MLYAQKYMDRIQVLKFVGTNPEQSLIGVYTETQPKYFLKIFHYVNVSDPVCTTSQNQIVLLFVL